MKQPAKAIIVLSSIALVLAATAAFLTAPFGPEFGMNAAGTTKTTTKTNTVIESIPMTVVSTQTVTTISSTASIYRTTETKLASISLTASGATTTTTSLSTITRTIVGAESQCEFTTTCVALSPSGLELILSVNSTAIRPNGVISISVDEFNTLPAVNNLSYASGWTLPKLRWLCGPDIFPNGIALFRGYYGLNNLTSSASSLWFWAPVSCAPPYLFDGTSNRIVGILGNVTSYAFQPKSDNASYSAIYAPECGSNPPQNCSRGSLIFGEFSAERFQTGTTIYATGPNPNPAVNSLLSTAPSAYTLVAGDEWGDLTVLHFAVTSP